MTTDQRKKLYDLLNEIDDTRLRRVTADSTGRHEPSSVYGGLYAIEEVDDNLVERSDDTGFVPLAALTRRWSNVAPTKRRPDARPRKKRPTGTRFVPCVFRRAKNALEMLGGITVPTYS